MAVVPHGVSKSERNRPLREAVDRVAYGANLTHRQAAIAISHFVEAVAMLVARGEFVSIDGFGAFLLRRSKKRGNKYPAFRGCQGFQNECRFGAEPKPEHEKRWDTFWKNTSRRDPRSLSKRTFTHQQSLRVQIEARHAYAYDDGEDD